MRMRLTCARGTGPPAESSTTPATLAGLSSAPTHAAASRRMALRFLRIDFHVAGEPLSFPYFELFRLLHQFLQAVGTRDIPLKQRQCDQPVAARAHTFEGEGAVLRADHIARPQVVCVARQEDGRDR